MRVFLQLKVRRFRQLPTGKGLHRHVDESAANGPFAEHDLRRTIVRDPRHTRTMREEKNKDFMKKQFGPPMALRIGLLGSSALQNDGHIKPVILQCRTPQETNPKGHRGPKYFLRNAPLNGDVDILAAS